VSNIRKNGAVLFAKDAKRVARFYELVAGMKRTHEDPGIIVLESPGSQLVVHPIPLRIARTLTIDTPPARRTLAAVKLVFAVKSIADARKIAPGLGGALEPPPRMFEARGFRACDGVDPEGNVIQFREKAAAQKVAKAPEVLTAKRRVDFETVRNLALTLPDVKDTSTVRGLSFKVRGKLFACKAIHRSAEPGTLLARVGSVERDRLMAEHPSVYYLTAHYQEYECVLVRLASINHKGLQEVLERAWKFVTSAPVRTSQHVKRKRPRVFRDV
jgi:hypothetical protein